MISGVEYILCRQCRRPAFYLLRRVAVLAELRAADAVYADGTAPIQGEPILCGSCGEWMGTANLADQYVRDGPVPPDAVRQTRVASFA